MVKLSSERRTSASALILAVVSASVSVSGLTVVPLFPVVGEAGFGGIAAEEEDEEVAEEGFVVALGEVLGDALEGDDPAEGLDNKPEIRQRRRTFHIV